MRKSHEHVLATLSGNATEIRFRPFNRRRDFIGLDTNILKNLYREVRINTKLRTLCAVKRPVLIIPHQVQAEFWGNFVRVEKEKRNKQQNELKKIENSIKVLEKNKTDSFDFLDNFRISFDEFYELWDNTSQDVVFEEAQAFLDELLGFGVGPRLADDAFYKIAEQRYQRKIPPGFEDAEKGANRYGDFFAWAEFLAGVVENQILHGFDPQNRLIFVSGETKPDWRCAGNAHPFLTEEANRCTNLNFELMDFEEFERYLDVETTPEKKRGSDLERGEVLE